MSVTWPKRKPVATHILQPSRALSSSSDDIHTSVTVRAHTAAARSARAVDPASLHHNDRPRAHISNHGDPRLGSCVVARLGPAPCAPVGWCSQINAHASRAWRGFGGVALRRSPPTVGNEFRHGADFADDVARETENGGAVSSTRHARSRCPRGLFVRARQPNPIPCCRRVQRLYNYNTINKIPGIYEILFWLSHGPNHSNRGQAACIVRERLKLRSWMRAQLRHLVLVVCAQQSRRLGIERLTGFVPAPRRAGRVHCRARRKLAHLNML